MLINGIWDATIEKKTSRKHINLRKSIKRENDDWLCISPGMGN